MKLSRELTAPTPHKVIREMSLYLGKFEPQPHNAGWSFTKKLQNSDGHIKVTCINRPTAQDGMIFNFVMSNLFATRKHFFVDEKGKMLADIRKVTSEAYAEFTIDLRVVLVYQGKGIRTENRQTIINSLKNLVGTVVEMKTPNATLIFTPLSSVDVDDSNPNIVVVKVNEKMGGVFYQADLRFINIERAMSLRSNYAIELITFLQTRGSGIRNGAPTTPAAFKHSDLVHFLHLEGMDEKSQIDTIRKALIQVKTAGFNGYARSYMRGEIHWTKEIDGKFSYKPVAKVATKVVANDTKTVVNDTKVVAKIL